MTKLLILSSAILAAGDLAETDDAIQSADAIYPKHVVEGWQIVEAEVPEGFTPAGYAWSGSQVVAKPPVVVPEPVPEEVSMGQAREALIYAGLLGTINSAVAAIPGTAGDIARSQWEFRTVVRRDWPLVEQMRLALGWSSEQVDDLFRKASKL